MTLVPKSLYGSAPSVFRKDDIGTQERPGHGAALACVRRGAVYTIYTIYNVYKYLQKCRPPFPLSHCRSMACPAAGFGMPWLGLTLTNIPDILRIETIVRRSGGAQSGCAFVFY